MTEELKNKSTEELLEIINNALNDVAKNSKFEFDKEHIKNKIQAYMDNMPKSLDNVGIKVVCDETNNSKEDIENNILKVDLLYPKSMLQYFIENDVQLTEEDRWNLYDE
jgi:hypothetical protein